MRIYTIGLVCAGLLSTAPGSSSADTGPAMTMPEDLLGVAAVTCIRIDDAGHIDGIYVITSSVAHTKDPQIIAAVSQLHWGPVTAGDTSRHVWVPMEINFGNATTLPTPQTCPAPPANLAPPPHSST